MLKMPQWLHHLHTCKRVSEKVIVNSTTSIWKKWIKTRLCPRNGQLAMDQMAEQLSRCFLTLSKHFIVLTTHGHLSTLFLLLKEVLLYWHFHNLLPLPQQKNDCKLISFITATSAKTKSPSLNLFSLLYPQTQKIWIRGFPEFLHCFTVPEHSSNCRDAVCRCHGQCTYHCKCDDKHLTKGPHFLWQYHISSHARL
jgi:hypothetical protein